MTDITLDAIHDAVRAAYEDSTILVLYRIDGQQHEAFVSQKILDDAARYRVESKSIAQIARIMELPKQLVSAIVRLSLKQRDLDSPDEMRKIELDKLDALERGVLDILWANEGAEDLRTRAQALKAIDTLVRLSESRRKLLGLDAPQVVESKPIEVQINGVDVSQI